MRKCIVSIIVFGLFKSICFSQSSLISVETMINKFLVDTIEYKQVNLSFSNETKDNYVLWIDPDNKESWNNDTRIKKYFFTKRGDFSLSSLLYEEFSNDLSCELYLSFFKILKPDHEFIISLLIKSDKNPDQIINVLKKQVVVIRANESNLLPKINDLEKLDYRGLTITILEDMIKITN